MYIIPILTPKYLICNMIILENEYLRAAITPVGAELQSLLHKTTGIEHMWNGDAKYWPKYSPVLFPIVGLLKDDTYTYQNKTYILPRHGFAREKTFSSEMISPAEVLFTLKADEETRAVYPFEFILKLRYRIHENSFSCTYEVINAGNSDLLFSVGAHPAFAVPFTKDGSYDEYYLKFNKTENLQRWNLQDGILTNSTQPLPTSNNRLLISAALFYKDALVLKNLQSNQLTLTCNNHSHGMHFSFNGFPYFGIWAAKDAPFVCLEPWCGIADNITHNHDLEKKEGIERLPAGEDWKRTWEVECF